MYRVVLGSDSASPSLAPVASKPVLIALLLGFFAGSVATVHLVNVASLRTYAGVLVPAICEALVVFRRRVRQEPLPLTWQLLDNGRIGLIYGIVLEAFKVGT